MMKNTIKKILCSLLVVVMCLSAAPLEGLVDFDWSWIDFSARATAEKTDTYDYIISIDYYDHYWAWLAHVEGITYLPLFVASNKDNEYADITYSIRSARENISDSIDVIISGSRNSRSDYVKTVECSFNSKIEDINLEFAHLEQGELYIDILEKTYTIRGFAGISLTIKEKKPGESSYKEIVDKKIEKEDLIGESKRVKLNYDIGGYGNKYLMGNIYCQSWQYAYTINKNSSFTITTKQDGYNEGFFELSGVECFIGDNKISQNESTFKILQSDLKDDITLKKEGFRDYIIPCEVAKTFLDGYNFKAYMSLDKKDGKPYISSVFAKNSSETQYQDLFKSPMIAENYNTYDIIMSGVGLSSNARYYISQDSVYKISNNSSEGAFFDADLYSKLIHNKTVYAYAVDSGITTDLEKLSLSKSSDDGALKRILETSTYSLGGSGGITIKIPDGNPLFGNSEISLEAFSAPLTVYYDTTNDTYIGTIGFDLYSYTQRDKTVSNASGSLTKFGEGETKKAFENFKESFTYFNNTPFAEEEKDKNGKSYKDEWTSFVNRCKTASKYSQKIYDKNFSADFLGYLEFAVTEQGFTIKNASLKVGADFSYSYAYQGAAWVIPVYFKTTLGVSASLEGEGQRTVVDRDIPFEYEIILDVNPKLALEAGIGVEALAKAGVEASGTVPFKVEFLNQHMTLKLNGEINIKTKAFIFTWNKNVWEGELDILDKYWGASNTYALRRMSGVPQYVVSVDEDDAEINIDS